MTNFVIMEYCKTLISGTKPVEKMQPDRCADPDMIGKFEMIKKAGFNRRANALPAYKFQKHNVVER